MSFEGLQRLVTAATAALAFAAVAMGGYLPVALVLILGVGHLLAFLLPEGRLPKHLVALGAVLAFPLAGFGFTRGIDLVILAGSYAALLLMLRVLARDGAASHEQVHLLSVVVLSGAAVLSPDVSFLFAFIPYVFALTFALLLAQLRRSGGETLLRLPAREVIGAQLVYGVLGLTVVAVFTTGLLFVVFPRTPLSLGFRRPGGQMTGLSDSVHLSGFGKLKENDQPVLRVRPQAAAQGSKLDGLYWRAHVLSVFDGLNWSAAPRETRWDPRLKVRAGYHPQLEVEVVTRLPKNILPLPGEAAHLQPLGKDGGGRPIRLFPAGATMVKTMFPAQPPWHFGLDLKNTALALDSVPPDPSELKLPGLDPRIQALADQLRRRAGGVEALPGFIENELSSTYGYTLELPGQDPSLAAFLFERKEGHCEYFATAMAVLLRAEGVPARLATGFYSGVWSDQGGYQLLRQGDAHAWVEVWRTGAGWLRYDPTPVAGRGSQRGEGTGARLSEMWDAAQARWSSLVLDYDLRSQLRVLRALQEASTKASQSLGELTGGGEHTSWGRRLLAFLVLAILTLLGGLALRRVLAAGGEDQAQGPARRRVTALYRWLWRRLQAQGYGLEPSTCAQELLQTLRAERALASASKLALSPSAIATLTRFLSEYEAVRFGQRGFGAAQARVWQRDLKLALRSRSGG